MKIKFDRKDLSNYFINASNIIPQKSSTFYLRCLWLKAQNGKLSIMSTDGDLQYCAIANVHIDEEGAVGVHGRYFVDLLKKLPDGEIILTLQTLENNIQILLLEHERRQYKLPISESLWYKEMSLFPEEQGVIWSSDVLSELIEKVIFCIADSDTEASGCLYMKPVYLPESLPNTPETSFASVSRIEVCGLNGHQFALKNFTYDELHEMLPESGILIKKKYLEELKKWISGFDYETVKIALTDKHFFIEREMANYEMLSIPLSTFTYHNYEFFLQRLQDTKHNLIVDRVECIQALTRISIFHVNEDKCTFFELSQDEAVLSAQGQTIGSAKEEIVIQYDGDIQRIAFPTKELIEIMNNFRSEKLQLTLTEADGPCGIQGKDDPDYIVVIMPMKFAEANYYSKDDV